MAKVKHRVGIAGDLDAVFSALTSGDGFSAWWATSAVVDARLGGKIDLTFENLTVLSFEYLDIRTPEFVHIRCTQGPGPWLGSELLFELQRDDDQVFVTLTHRNDAASEDDFLYFSTKWTCYLLSLRDWIESGRGMPYPNDLKIHVGD